MTGRGVEIETVATGGRVVLTFTDEHGHMQTYEMSADAAARVSKQLARAVTYAMGSVSDESGKVSS